MFPGYAEHGKIFENWADKEWRPLVDKLLALDLSPAELKTLARSTQYAHYTSEGIVRGIYSALESRGFPGGKILEPGMGSGNFIGAMPDSIYGASRYTGLEMDHLTASIAKYLYPQQNILQADYTKKKLPSNFFDLAIGNPPFGKIPILTDPEYKKFKFPIHDYFFAKTIDQVRPGGLMVFVTSRYTMDKVDDKARAYLADRADLLGAVRLPQTAFAQHSGTEVVTDILFLRKHEPGVETAGEMWKGLKEVQTPEGPVSINEYYADRPEMILGRNSLQGSMYGANQYTVLPNDGSIDEQFAAALENLPESIYSSARVPAEQQRAQVAELDFNPKIKKEGGVYLNDDGVLMRVEHGAGQQLDTLDRFSKRDMEWLSDYVPLRDALKQAKADQWNDGDWELSLKEVNRRYKEFVSKHGRILEYTTIEKITQDEDGNDAKTVTRKFKNNSLLKKDTEGALVFALEAIDDNGIIKEAAFLKERTIRKPDPPQVKTLSDALAVSLDTLGSFDLNHVAELANVSRQEVIEGLGDLVYETTDGAWQLSDEYLSGNVVRKLEEAEQAARMDDRFKRNVEALSKVQPKPLTNKDISVKLGSTWLDPGVIEEFASEVLGAPMSISYVPATGKWIVTNSAPKKKDGWYYGRRGAPKAARPHGLRGAGGEWSTADRGPNELLDSILNNLSIKITRTDENKKTYTDTEATAAANEKASEIRKRFSAWIWEDSERAGILLDEYNKRFNNIAPRRFDGAHLTLPGVSLKYKLHPHQLRAIWRVIQTGDTYLAHAVGAGKTIEMIASGMEMKRLGLIAKPLYVVPNHMLEQFSSEFVDLYPLANIMVADETNFHTSNRRRFMAQAAMNNPDAVIITHSSYGLLGMKPENVTQVRDEILDELREYLSELADEEGAKSQKVKQLESRIEAAEQRFDSIAVNEKADQSMTFEDLGCDFLFVDEAHQFRKLDFTTSRQVKGIDPQGSRAALDMYVKTRWLQSRRPGRAIVFASGTPITNTIGELYTIQRFFNHSLMEEDGIHHFDAWSAMFGEVEPGFEMNAAGRYEVVERFSRFDNLPELSKRVRMFMDVLTSDQLSAYVKRPEIKGGQPEIIVVPPSEEMKDYQQHTLLPRIERSKKWKPSREQRFNPDPVIAIIADGRLAAIDMRFVDNSLPSNPDSKLNRMIDGIIEAYHETKDLQYTDKETGATESIKGGAQIVFYNQGMGAGVAKNRGFNARAWVMKRLKEAKIPAKEIAWIDDYSTADKKEAMMKEVRQGQKRILFGSAKKMGTGINVQKRLVAMHYLDPPWYPADVTQPDGRILRQGNQNEVVTLKRYATKGSYDSTQWQMVARKAKAIESFLNGDDSVRSIEDLSESNQFAMASALASGDERVIQLAGLQADVERLTTLQNSHAQEQSTLRYKRTNAESNIKWAKGRISDLKEAGNKIGGHIREFAGDVGGREYTNREEFGQALLDKYTELVDGMIDDPPKKGGTKPLGTINGFRISLQYHVSTDLDTKSTYVRDPSFLLEITDKISGTVVRADYGKFELNESPRGLTDKIINTLNGVARELRELEQKEQDLQEELAVIVKRLGAPYSYAKELAEKVAEVTRLQNELAAEGEQQAADTGTLPGQEFIEDAGGTDALYSNPMFNPKLIVNSLSGLAGNLKEDIPKLVRLGRRVIHEGASTFQTFAKAMRGYLGDKWGTFKNRMLSIFGKAKEAYRNSPLGNDVGAIGDIAGVKAARNVATSAATAADIIINAAKDYVSSADAETMARSAARLFNPTDISRTTKTFKETFPRAADAMGWLFNIPTFQGERDARSRKADEVSIKDFVDTGINRANNNMEFQLEMQAWDGLDPNKPRKAPSFWQRMKEGITTWEATDTTTEWGRIEKDVRENLDQKQRDALDVMQREGDINNEVYSSLAQAMKNRRIAAAKPTPAVFDAYKRVRNFIDGPMVEARERLIQRLGESTGADKVLVAKTIKAYRTQIGELKGWMPRKHGEGVHQVNVYHIIRSLPFVARAIEVGHAATLPFYAGKDVQREIRKFAREHMLVIHRDSTGAPIVVASDKTREKIQKAITTLEGRLAKTSDEMKRVLYEEQLQALHSKLAIASRPSNVRIQEFMEASKGFLSNIRSQYEASMQPLRNQMAEARAKGAHKGEILRIKSEMDKLGDGTVKVKVYMRLNETQRQAEKLKAEVSGNFQKHLDHVYHPGEQYTTTYKVIDPASEGMYGDIAGDFAAENIIKKAIDRAQQTGKIGGKDAAGVRDSLFRNYADIMLARGAGRSQITRAPYLIQGYDQADTNQLYHDYMTAAAGMLSKAMYAKQQFDNYRYAPADIKPWAETYIKDTLRNMGHADRIGANVRAVATFMYLGLKMSSVLVNATQTWTLGVAELGRRTKQNSIKAIGTAQLDILRSNLSTDEQALFDNQLWKEQEMATAIHEMSGHGEGATGKASRFLHTLVGKSLIPFQEMEMMNRRTMVLAAYRSFVADGMSKEDAISAALDVNRMTNFEMGRANLPTWAHHPVGRTAYALQSFVWNNWNWIYNRATSGDKADMLALLKYASMISVIGGVTALGGGDEANKIIRRLTGKDYRLAMQAWSRTHAKEYGTAGEMLHAAVWHGGMGALGVNISNAMRLNIPMSGFITGESTAGESAMGIWSGLADKASNAAMYASRGQYGRAAESAAPEVISSPMKAYRMATQGATTSHGKPVFDENGKPVKYSGLDAVKRAVGIQPLEQSSRSEAAQSVKVTQSFWREQRSELIDSLRMAGSAAERKDVVREILKFNRDVRKSQAWPVVGVITSESISRSVAASKPDKKRMASLRKFVD